MTWQKILKSHSERSLHFTDEVVSFAHLAADMYSIKEDFIHWNGEWSRKSIVKFLSALDSGVSIFSSAPEHTPPEEAKALGKGWLFLRSSGTMGPSRWIAHPQKLLFELTPLYHHKNAALLLKPGHAAGIEALLTGIAGGSNLYLLNEAKNLENMTSIDVLHGPPQVLGFLLSFPSKFSGLLSGLETFYNGTDVLHPAIAEKLSRSGFHFKVRQIYGTSETWRIETETHPDRPQLFRITDPHVKVENQEIVYSSGKLAKYEFTPEKRAIPASFTVSDKWIEEEKSWGRLEPRKSWVANFHGEKVNLFDLEDRLMKVTGIADVQIIPENGILGPRLHVKIFVSDLFTASRDELTQILNLPPSLFSLEISPFTEPFSGKRQRQR